MLNDGFKYRLSNQLPIKTLVFVVFSFIFLFQNITFAVTTKTADYTITGDDDVIFVDSTYKSLTMTLPSAVGISGKQYTIKKIDNSANVVTIATTLSQTINGSSTQIINTTPIVVQSDGSNWTLVSGTPFHPTTLSGLVSLFDADYGVTEESGNAYKAISFDSTLTQYVGATATTTFNPGAGDFTIGFSVYLDSLPTSGYRTFYQSGTIGSTQDFIWGNIYQDGNIAFYMGDGATTLYALAASFKQLSAGRWYTIIVRHDRDTGFVIKVDGATYNVAGNLANFTSSVDPGGLKIGGYAAGATIPGKIDGFFYMSRASTDAEDTWLNNSGAWRQFSELGVVGTAGENLTPSVIKGWYDFENGSVLGTDSSGNGKNLATTGSPTQTNGINYRALSVSSWRDTSSNNYNFSQSLPLSQPSYSTDAINGHSALSFTGNMNMTTTLSSSLGRNFTIFAVAKKTNPVTSTSTLLDGDSGNHTTIGSNANGRWVANLGTEIYSQRSEISNYHIFSLAQSGSTSIIGVDGYEKIDNAGSNSMGDGIILGQDNTGSNQWVGNLAELIIFNRSLSLYERNMLQKYLSLKYALPLGKMIVYFDGASIIYSRTPYSATYDLIQQMNCDYVLNSGGASIYRSSVCSYIGGGIIVPATNADSSKTGSITIDSLGDDIAPININGTYFAGDHGAAYGLTVTVASHDKTNVDIGSKWSDSSNNQYTLMATAYNNDATHLLFVSDNSSVSTPKYWSFRTTIVGSSLTHVSGATNTGSITFTGQSLVQIFPAIRNVSKSILLNGTTVPSGSGTHLADFFDVRHIYEGLDLDSVVNYVQSQVGSASAPSFDHASISSLFTRDITYRFQPTGVSTVDETLTIDNSISRLSYGGFIQGAAPIIPSSGTLKLYAPKIEPFSLNGNNYNPSSIQDITNLLDSWYLTSSYWSDPNDPPERVLEYSLTSGDSKYVAKQIGYIPELMNTALNRKANVNYGVGSLFVYNSSKKMYPSAMSGGSVNFPGNGTLTSGSTYRTVAFRSLKNGAELPVLTDVVVYNSPYSNDYYLTFDSHQNFDGNIILPPWLTGYNITVVDSNENTSILDSTVEDDGVHVVITNNYGYGILKLSVSAIGGTPTVSLTSPTESANVSGIINLAATATDNTYGISGVKFYYDNTIIGSEITSPSSVNTYTTTWNTADAANGSHTISAVARNVNNSYSTSTVNIVISNIVSTPSPGSSSGSSGSRVRLGPLPTTSPVPKIISRFIFTKNLREGMRSNDVKNLQIFLNNNGFFVTTKGPGSKGNETNYFGPATKSALMKFQQYYKKEILLPLGIQYPTGIFGEKTRKVFNSFMGI